MHELVRNIQSKPSLLSTSGESASSVAPQQHRTTHLSRNLRCQHLNDFVGGVSWEVDDVRRALGMGPNDATCRLSDENDTHVAAALLQGSGCQTLFGPPQGAPHKDVPAKPA